MTERKSKATEAAVPPSVQQNVEAAVNKWYTDNLANSVVSRDTAVHNLIHDAKPALVQAVIAAVGQPVVKE